MVDLRLLCYFWTIVVHLGQPLAWFELWLPRLRLTLAKCYVNSVDYFGSVNQNPVGRFSLPGWLRGITTNQPDPG